MRTATPAILLWLAALVAAGTACGRQEPGTGAAPRTEGPAPRSVRVVAAVEERLPRTAAVTGTLAADESVVVGFKVAGRLAELTVDLG
ncbi:MAG TPA: hypothetical protein VJB36_08190, partial [Methylomirabilota bacterium]|nr:hypothetical protein [Methylomirabilota bacterium]